MSSRAVSRDRPRLGDVPTQGDGHSREARYARAAKERHEPDQEVKAALETASGIVAQGKGLAQGRGRATAGSVSGSHRRNARAKVRMRPCPTRFSRLHAATRNDVASAIRNRLADLQSRLSPCVARCDYSLIGICRPPH